MLASSGRARRFLSPCHRAKRAPVLPRAGQASPCRRKTGKEKQNWQRETKKALCRAQAEKGRARRPHRHRPRREKQNQLHPGKPQPRAGEQGSPRPPDPRGSPREQAVGRGKPVLSAQGSLQSACKRPGGGKKPFLSTGICFLRPAYTHRAVSPCRHQLCWREAVLLEPGTCPRSSTTKKTG